jgi:membrane protease YdiL (CAAX protease family)
VLAVLLGGIVAQVGAGFVLQLSLAFAMRRAGGAPEDAQALARSLPVLGPAMLISSGVLLLTAWMTPAVLGLAPARSLGLRPAPPSLYVAASLGTLALAPLADLFMRTMAELFPTWTFGAMEGLRELAVQSPILVLWPLLALMPGLGEELLFRGLLQRSIAGVAKPVLISGVTFALFHVDPHHVAGVLPLGLFLAWVAAAVGSTWVSVVAHVVNNSASILATRFETFDVGYGAPAPMPLYWVPVGLMVTAGCAYWIVRVQRERRERHES